MLQPRNFITVVFILAFISIVWSVLKLAEPPDSDGLGRDSYGTRYYGYKAYLDILQELGISSERSLVPPKNMLNREMTLVIVDPDAWLVTTEPGHLVAVREWVEGGGRLILAMGSMSEIPERNFLGEQDVTTALEALSIDQESILLYEEEAERRAERRHEEQEDVESEDDEEEMQDYDEFYSSYSDEWAGYDQRFTSTESEKLIAELNGDWESLDGDINWLQLPTESLQVIATPEDGETSATASVAFIGGDNEAYRIAARYPAGEGDIILISDSRVLRNFLIFQQDNAVLATHFAAEPGKAVVFDEFYHGLTVRGNPAWLLGRHPYGLLSIILVITVVIWIARTSIRLGPPLRPPSAGRRAIDEYVDAMASMFDRGGCQNYLLREMRDGIIWSIANELRLSHKHRTENRVLMTLRRRDPARAEKLQKALAETDVILSGEVNLSQHAKKKAVTESARKLNECI